MQPTNGQPSTDKPTFRPIDHRPDHDRPTTRRRVTVAEAAILLGISEDAVRSRLKRGTLGKEKAADGTVLVVLGEGGSTDRHTTNDQPRTGQTTDHPTDEATDQAELVEALQQRIEHLSRIIDTRDEEIRRRDTIIMSLTQRIPELEAPGEERDGTEMASPRSSDGGTLPGGSEETTERRSWLYRFFFGP
jgi:hypothetical protein